MECGECGLKGMWSVRSGDYDLSFLVHAVGGVKGVWRTGSGV